MKIALLLGAFSVGARPLDLATAASSPRGLTGTELCFVRTLEELTKLGHEVHPRLGDAAPALLDESYDAAVSLNEPNLLIGCKARFRVVWQMLNDFSFIKPGFDEHVDAYAGVCAEHTAHVAQQCPHPEKWTTIGLGCDPDLYTDCRVPGRVLYASSADRGLHWLLQQWPEIRRAVPNATLRVLYHFSYAGVESVTERSVSPQGGPFHPHIVEMAQRIRYCRSALERLGPLGVTHVGSVSREQMTREWSEAAVFAYPCDPVAFSEGFSVSSLEAHASGTVPVLWAADCLGGIYGESGCLMLPRGDLSRWTAAVISALRGLEAHRLPLCRQFAKEHTWAHSAKQLETLLASRTTAALSGTSPSRPSAVLPRRISPSSAA